MNSTSWLPIPADSGFSLHNLPFGIYSVDGPPRAGVAVGDQILDLTTAATLGLCPDVETHIFQQPVLNDFIRQGKKITEGVRRRLMETLTDDNSPLREAPLAFVPQSRASMHLPVDIGDYTDFYASIEHATNVGTMFRDPENALLPNWRHLPVGYHGRSSSIVVSGTPIRRPCGQVMPPDGTHPVFQPTSRLDFELELAFVIGRDSSLGTPIGVDAATDYIFGLVLFNDWSARDIQQWEYVPLGPFLGKNFASSMSPWIVPLEALEPFRVAGPVQEPAVLPYLQCEEALHFDINLEVGITPAKGEETIVSRSNARHLYWNMAQQLAHHTVNGCNVRVGDVMASGTISGASRETYGSMLELSWNGAQPIQLANGSTRAFLDDHDTVTMRGIAEKEGIRVGFGDVHAQILPARH